MSRIAKTTLVVAIVLAAGWVHAAPASAPDRTPKPGVVQVSGGFSLLDEAGALLERLWTTVLELVDLDGKNRSDAPGPVVIEKPKAEGISGQG